MIRIPTAYLEKKRLSRVIFSIRVSPPSGYREIYSLMKKIYDMGIWCLDLPAPVHLDSFRALRELTEDESLIGFGHLNVEEGVSFQGKPLHQYESKLISTIKREFLPCPSSPAILPDTSSSEVFSQKEIDRITFDPSRFDRSLSRFRPEETPFLLTGGKYGDWLLAMGRTDLLKEMVSRIRKRGLIPIFSGLWASFSLPKAKPLDFAAYAIPINQKRSFFDLTQACALIKKFDKPVISLNPLDDGRLSKKLDQAFSFLFQEMKIPWTIVEISLEEEVMRMAEAVKSFPSLIPHRKA